MLHGGLPWGRPYVLTGPTGSGKTTLAVQFLVDGLRRGEACLFIALDEPPHEVKTNTAAFGWNLDELTALDATPDIKAHKKRDLIDVGTTLDVRGMDQVRDVRKSSQLRTMEVSVHSVQKMIKQSARDLREREGQRYSRIVVDSMTALKRFSLRGEDARILIQSFFRFLSELEVTTIVVSNPLNSKLDTEFLLARGEITLHKRLDRGHIKRALSIERMRGSAFDEGLRPFEIGPHGINVYADSQLVGSGPMLLGIGRGFLEGRVAEEVNTRMDEVLEILEAVRKDGGQTAEAESAMLRGLVAVHRKRYEEAMRHMVTAKAKLEEEKTFLAAAKKARRKK